MARAHSSANSQPPSIELTVRQGPRPGQRFSLTRPTITIGREAGSDVVVNHPQVSRRHASLTWDGRQFVIHDLGSANGTFVNGVRLTAPHALQPGDLIGLGPTVLLTFQTRPVAAPPAVSPAHPEPRRAEPPARRRRRILIPLLALLGLCCLLAVAAAAGYYFLWPRGETRPLVLIRSPRHGEQVEVGQEVTVHSIARDEGKVVRVELWVDGQLQESQAGTLPGGTSPFPLLARWQPLSPGIHTLTVRAFNAKGSRAHASVNVEAIEKADRDGDGVADETDACPDEPGSATANGCPDRDGDGVPDADDACPDEVGIPEADGCLGPIEGDRDGDGIPDEADVCPDEPGSLLAEGCPDADGDTVPDAEDLCPDEPGPPDSSGCPAPSEGDRDGDTIPDAEDACPDDPGLPWAGGCPDADGDGVRDSEDACPDEPGPPEHDGCPVPGGEEDSDSDGVADVDDACPDEPGRPEHDGCPDRDGDGVPDGEDLRPDEPGEPEAGGAPPGPDRDGDGVPDAEDLCPDEPGLPEHAGCPPPGEGEDADGDGIPDDEEPPEDPRDMFEFPPGGLFELPERTPVEFEALEFEVYDDYDEIYCYVGLGGGDMERYGSFEPLGERRWDIAEYLGGENSRILMMPSGEPLEVHVECSAYNIYRFPGGEEATYWDLGSFIRDHPPSDWDGHVITVRSTEGADGRSFQAKYRICAGSCAEAVLPSPMLHLYHGLGDHQLVWLWDGDSELLEGFKVYLNGSHILSVEEGTTSLSVRSYEPPCGERYEFYITAYGGVGRESPPSNTVYWTAPACPRTVRVTFERLTTFSLGDDEWWADDVGPIFGYFEATGSTERQLSFDAVDYGEWWGERIRGYRLDHHSEYSIQEIFDWIQRTTASCIGEGCPDYHGPEVNYVTVQLGPYDDLTFGGAIFDADTGNPSDTLFRGEYTLPAGEIVPGRYTIRNRNIELSALVDVIVGPEAGDLPDLTIADVTRHEPSGQLRIHVFNNAADLVNEDITLNLVRISTNEQIALYTWENVTIPSGGERILQSSDLIMEPHDLRVIVDPDNQIEEMNERNNIFETPVMMRVEFLRVYAPSCNETSCNIFDCDSEHVFYVWAGHGPSASDITWTAYNVRFPPSGEIRVCGREPCTSDEAWRMEGDPRYTFDIEMPASDNLYVMVTGYEQDGPTANDSLGQVFYEYIRDMGWGARSEAYEASYGRETPCDDWFCIPCSRGLWASWRITRVH